MQLREECDLCLFQNIHGMGDPALYIYVSGWLILQRHTVLDDIAYYKLGKLRSADSLLKKS